MITTADDCSSSASWKPRQIKFKKQKRSDSDQLEPEPETRAWNHNREPVRNQNLKTVQLQKISILMSREGLWSVHLETLSLRPTSEQLGVLHVQKFRSGQEDEYRDLIQDFVTWCVSNHLMINTTKTREMVVDFWRPRPHPEPVIIKEDCVEVPHTYKYLAVQLEDELDRTARARTRYFLRRPASFKHLQEAATDLLPVHGS